MVPDKVNFFYLFFFIYLYCNPILADFHNIKFNPEFQVPYFGFIFLQLYFLPNNFFIELSIFSK